MISVQEQKFNRINFRDRISHIDIQIRQYLLLQIKGSSKGPQKKTGFLKVKLEWGKKKLLAKKPLVEARSPFQRASHIFPSVDQEIATLTG